MELLSIVEKKKKNLEKSLSKDILYGGETLYTEAVCQILSQSAKAFDFMIEDDKTKEYLNYKISLNDQAVFPLLNDKTKDWDKFSYACFLTLENELKSLQSKDPVEYKKYTREGMMKRVLLERKQKADKAQYRVEWAENIYGPHILTNEKGVKYEVFLRDFENETGYSNSADSRHNKLGTTKHIMFAFQHLKTNKSLYKKLNKNYPFIEIYLDPLNNYAISWHFPSKLTVNDAAFLNKYFNAKRVIKKHDPDFLLSLTKDAASLFNVYIREEVLEKVESVFEKNVLNNLEKKEKEMLDFSLLKVTPFTYQKEGISFASFKKGCIIADEMGLGKTIQAIGAAVMKKELFGFKKTLVVCPASLKSQWKSEIEKFSHEKALIIEGSRLEKVKQYADTQHYFLITNYEALLRDQTIIANAEIDFLILDEAQKVKNMESKVGAAIKRLKQKHTLVITGTPIENKLIDLYSIVNTFDPEFLGPLWEFSYQHCLFDTDKINKINGYYNLSALKEKMKVVLLRREKKNVLKELPNLTQHNIFVPLTPVQAEMHGGYVQGLAKLLCKKFLTAYDLQKMQILLTNMRMVCDSSFLVDNKTNESPKLDELKDILINKLDIHNNNRKIIIFSEWVTMHKLIGQMLRANNIAYAELNGKVPVKLRGDLIKKFENDDNCKIFLSTEAGGSGLNLQVADTLINFELPWNPAKKNQRIGRIDRFGQKSNKLTVFNFISRNSIEEQIATGLLVKQSLFDGVLNEGQTQNYVDFTNKGRSQFIQQLEEFIAQTAVKEAIVDEDHQHNVIVDAPEEKVDLSGEKEEYVASATNEIQPSPKQEFKAEEVEQVMQNGLQFLAGLFKMSTGKDMGVDAKSISIDKESGEVTMKFKLPI